MSTCEDSYSVKNIMQTSMIQNVSPPRPWSCNNGHAWHFLFLLLLLLLLIQTPPLTTAQLVGERQMDPNNSISVDIIMGIVALMFLISGLLSIFSRQCANQRTRVDLTLATGGGGTRSHSEPCGLNQEVIDTFPIFPYSNVKGLKIGKETLACAVCLCEFQDEDTLRLIPKCSHVFHRSCIDLWLVSHSTCPVCRANLVPRPEDLPPMVSIHISDDHQEQHPNEEQVILHAQGREENNVVGGTGEDPKRDNNVEQPKVDTLRRSRTVNHSGPTRSKSTGFLHDIMFRRSNSMNHHSVLVQPGENIERFTLRLPDKVRSQVLSSSLKRAHSCVSFVGMSSGTRGYRTRSVGSGRSYLLYERVGSEEQLGFTLTPPFFPRNWSRSARKSPVQSSGVAFDNHVVERSSDLLCSGQQQHTS